MKVLSIRTLRGPNYWSNYRKNLIAMKLDLEAAEQRPSNTFPCFAEKLEELIPSLYEHRCSEGGPGGFFERVRKGTWMGHIVEHIALELQSLAGMECGYGRTRSTHKPGIYHVVFEYVIENAGHYAAKAAVRIAEALMNDERYDINRDLEELRKILAEEGPGPSTLALLNEARHRNIPVKPLEGYSTVMLGYGKHSRLISGTISSQTSALGVDLAGEKQLTRDLLEKGYIPVPKGEKIVSREELKSAIGAIGFPLVIKPSNGNHGRGVKINITCAEDAEKAFANAKKISDSVIVEKFIEGHDYRLLVINYKFQAAARRMPAMVIGNGKNTVEELINEVNRDPLRGEAHEKVLTRIRVDEITKGILSERGLGLDSVPAKEEIIFLKHAANLSAGGTASDVTDIVHPSNIQLAERVARLLNLDICGIDIITEDISSPISENGGAVIEVNASPGLRMHLSPSKGQPRNVAEPIIKMLFPPGTPSRIPIVAITGTNGKTTTTRLVAHLAKAAGHTVGFTNTDGVYINDQLIYSGDCSGPASAEVILRDPSVDFAVLECARGGILRAGLAFDNCDISIVTNIAEDHLGMDDIETIHELARVKSVVPRSTRADGIAILNADDDLVYRMRHEVDCEVALFSIHERNKRVLQHCAEGGMAAIVEKGFFTICKGEWKLRIARVNEVPLTQGGKASCMIKNILPAILAAAARDFDTGLLRHALLHFMPGPEFTPGRMNIFRFPQFEVMVDYVHNIHGFEEMKAFLQQVNATEKIGIVTAPGDRKDEDIIQTGRISAEIFDRIIIRHDEDMRGRDKEELTNLLVQGIRNEDASKPFEVVSNELEALHYAMETAKEGAFIVLSCEHTHEAINELQKRQHQTMARTQV